MVLARAENAHKISQSGVAALKAALDPFHDADIPNMKGWPDSRQGNSIIRTVHNSTTVTSLGTGGSIVVYPWPILNQEVIHSAARTGSQVTSLTDTSSNDSVIAPICIYNYTAAESSSPSPYFLRPATAAPQYHNIPPQYFSDGPMRLVGGGFEIHDVTAEISKQGTATIFEIEQDVEDTEVFFTADGLAIEPLTTYNSSSFQVSKLNRFPGSVGDAMIYPRSRQWDAKEGVYVVFPFNGDNHALYAEYKTPIIDTDPRTTPDIPEAVNIRGSYIGDYIVGTPASGTNYLNFYPNVYTPCNSRGVILSGLNAASTFTITSVLYVESFPSQASPLVTAAHRCAEHDPVALQILQSALQTLPIAVPVSENPFGEWFADVVESVMPWLGMAGSVAFPAFAPAIMGGSAALSTVAGQYGSKANKKKITKPLPKVPAKAALKNEVKQLVAQDVRNLAQQQTQKTVRKPLPPVPPRRK